MKKQLYIIGLGLLLLTGCSSMKEQLGYTKESPDEFSVVTRAPLSQPPDFTLKPPEPGVQRPQELETRDQAKQSVFVIGTEQNNAPVFTNKGKSKSEQLLLMKADAKDADPAIRRTVNQEAGKLVDEDDSIIDKVVFWKDPKDKPVVVDPTAEKERIETNKEEGKPVNEGDIKTVKQKDRGILEILD